MNISENVSLTSNVRWVSNAPRNEQNLNSALKKTGNVNIRTFQTALKGFYALLRKNF